VPQVVISAYGGPEVFTFEETILPAPGAGEVRVRVVAAGLNFAEVFCRLGLYRHAPPPPFVPGFEFAGEVESVGSGVDVSWVGTNVLGVTRFGGYQGGVVVGLDRIRPLPSGWTMEEGAGFPAAALTAAYGLLEPGRLRPGERVVIHSAAGGVGTTAVQMAHAIGAEVIGTCGSDEKLSVLQELGCRMSINYKIGDWAARVRDEIGPVDVVFDALGGKHLRYGYDLLRPGGRLISYGLGTMTPAGARPNYLKMAWQYLQIPRFSVFPLISDNKQVSGFNVLLLWDRMELLGRVFDQCLVWAESGLVRPRIGMVAPYRDVGRLHTALQSGQTTGKLVIRFDDE
jgi:synaptic vesicle membrane protein VAT-1